MSNQIVTYHKSSSSKQADQKYCHACAQLIHIDAMHCTSCGAPQQTSQSQSQKTISEHTDPQTTVNSAFCVGCGNLMHATARSCPKCGALSPGAPPIAGSKDKNIAGLFALLLGGIGAHHFYLGNIILGLLYLIFCWTFIPLIVGFIEGLIYLTQSDESFARKYP
jgi:RNA polymerase subunit RPABC4/transcription elongation factor Spt4